MISSATLNSVTSSTSTSTISTVPTPGFTPIVRTFTGLNITTQILVLGCATPPPVCSGIHYTCPPQPHCAPQYLTSDGHFVPLESDLSQGQAGQFNFTIPSTDGTCSGIISPFSL